MKDKQRGFTLIELGMVIVILVIIAATALPAFLKISDDRQTQEVRKVASELSSAVAQVKARWLQVGNNAAVSNLNGYGDGRIDTTTAGWPADGGAGDANSTSPTVSRCIRLWNALLKAPPSVTVGNGVADYRVSASGTRCEYRPGGTTRRRISYDLSNGSVSVDTNR